MTLKFNIDCSSVNKTIMFNSNAFYCCANDVKRSSNVLLIQSEIKVKSYLLQSWFLGAVKRPRFYVFWANMVALFGYFVEAL